MTKTFKEYLIEGKRQYDFRVKIAGEVTPEKETCLKSILERFTISKFRKSAKTPIQELPLDFPQVRNCEVNIYEVTLDYPTTTQELTEYLSAELNIGKQCLVVRRPGEPGEEYQTPQEKREGALLDDPDYKEAGNAQFEDYYGDKYNTGFVKELNDLLKLERKARGEVIPNVADDVTRADGKTTNDIPTYTTSPVKQAYDPRRK